MLKNRRLTALLLAFFVIGVGITSRLVESGWPLWDKYLGDALYAILLYLGITFLWPSGSISGRGWGAIIAVFAIETFQLTGIPRQMSQTDSLVLRLAAIALGTHFSWLDMVAYAVSISAATGLESRWSK